MALGNISLTVYGKDSTKEILWKGGLENNLEITLKFSFQPLEGAFEYKKN